MAASKLEDSMKFRNYIANLCGIKANIIGAPNDLLKAIKTLNKDVPMIEEYEFGFNELLNTYYTGDHLIRADGIKISNTPIRYTDIWGNNKLKFMLESMAEVKEVKKFIIDKFLRWDDPKVIINLLAFASFPVIYPFLKHMNPNKFYMMLIGPSGAGKSQMSKWIQNFYGNFSSLLAWTSTDTSVNIIGNAFKDAILTVDDLKVQNFRSVNDAKKIMMMLQNYSDGTSRQRASGDLSLRDEKVIKAHLLITAEDLVITESSTIARGIVIDVNSKPVNLKDATAITEQSKKFSSIMPYLIQFILKNYNQNMIGKIFEDSQKFIYTDPAINNPNISRDNLSRIINNFAALRTSWRIISEFLFEDQPESVKTDYRDTFDTNLIALLLDNIERISSYKPDIIFERTLWEMVENGTFALSKVSQSGKVDDKLYKGSKIVGYYTQDTFGNVNLIIQLSKALREMKKSIDNFAISEDTLKKKLLHDKKINVNPSKKFSLNGKKISGVQWAGDFPKSLFGIRESGDPVETAKKILAEEK